MTWVFKAGGRAAEVGKDKMVAEACLIKLGITLLLSKVGGH